LLQSRVQDQQEARQQMLVLKTINEHRVTWHLLMEASPAATSEPS
jgi:hypothetical protein